MMRLASAAAALLAVGCASGPPETGAAPKKLDQTPIAAPKFGGAEEEAILRTVDTFLLAVGNGDRELQKSVELPDGMTAYARITKDPGQTRIRRGSASQNQNSPARDPFIEMYWSPQVQVRGPFAQVWAPYELRDNGAVVHCGIDAFQLVKEADGWKIHSSMSTMEPDACSELGARSSAARRPRDGWKETPNQ